MKYSVMVLFANGFDTVLYEKSYEECRQFMRSFDVMSYNRDNNVIVDDLEICPEGGHSMFE